MRRDGRLLDRRERRRSRRSHVLIEKGLEPDKTGIGPDDDADRNLPQIGFEAPLAFKALAKAGSDQMIDKARNDAAGDINPAARPKCQGQIPADRAQQATEHVERGPAGAAASIKGGFGDRSRVAVWNASAVDRRQRLVKIFKARSGQRPFD